MSIIDNEVCNNFTSMLKPKTILAFRQECLKNLQEYPTKGNEKKIAKSIFISSLNSIFGKTLPYNNLYQLIFNRFKSYTCTLNQSKNDLCSLGHISTIEEIDLYEICCAFMIFSKDSFKKKIHFLFELTDYDSDDLINEREIQKIIYTLTLLFCVEEASIQINSKLIHQALAYQKANHIYSKIMKHPGELDAIIAKEKAITFTTFYSCLEKIDNYKTIIIPFHINFVQCLSEKKTETIIELKKSLSDEFVAISNDLIHCKNSVIGKKDPRKTIEFIASAPKNHIQNSVLLQKKIKKNEQRMAIKNGILPKKRVQSQIMMNKTAYPIKQIDYNKIYHLEVPPVQIIIKKDENYHNNNETEQTIKGVSSRKRIKTCLPKMNSTKMISMSKTFSNRFNSQNDLKTFNEVVGEIDHVLLRRQYDENYWGHMKDNLNKIKHTATTMKRYFRDKVQFFNLKLTLPSDIAKNKKK